VRRPAVVRAPRSRACSGAGRQRAGSDQAPGPASTRPTTH
jgi:hypothetical protein